MIFRKKDRRLLQRVELLLLRNLEIPRLRAEEDEALAEKVRVFGRPLVGTEKEIQAVINERAEADDAFCSAVTARSNTEYTYKRLKEEYQ